MARKPKVVPKPLAFPPTDHNGHDSDETPLASANTIKTPATPSSSRFSTRPFRSSENLKSHKPQEAQGRRPSTPTLEVEQSAATNESPPRTGLFSYIKGSKSSNKLQSGESRRPFTRDKSMFKSTDWGSSTEASNPLPPVNNNSKSERPPLGTAHSHTDSHLNSHTTSASTESAATSVSRGEKIGKKTKPKGLKILRRTASIKTEPDMQSPGESSLYTNEDESLQRPTPVHSESDYSGSARITDKVRAGRDQSSERQPTSQFDSKRQHAETPRLNPPGVLPRDASTGMLNKVATFGRSFFKPSAKPAGPPDRKGPLPRTELRVLTMPLVYQTRFTRIAKVLEKSRDKTEYWMPSFPWRAIDYLNDRGTSETGLYRIPGSSAEVHRWQARFDQELDVNFFDQEDLYDINIVATMLKAWLRDLPEPLIPKSTQSRIAEKLQDLEPGTTGVPDIVVTELSKLPPYNYYCLFAITCHLSILLENAAKNQMNFHNLSVCFHPCTSIDLRIFRYLVCNWHDCWVGCATESKWEEKEKEFDRKMNEHFRSMGIEEITEQERQATMLAFYEQEKERTRMDMQHKMIMERMENPEAQNQQIGSSGSRHEERRAETKPPTSSAQQSKDRNGHGGNSALNQNHYSDDDDFQARRPMTTDNGLLSAVGDSKHMLSPIAPLSPMRIPN